MKSLNILIPASFIFAILLFVVFNNFGENNLPPTLDAPQKMLANLKVDTKPSRLFSKQVLPNRFEAYCQHLQNKGINFPSSTDLLKLNDRESRRRFCAGHQIDSIWLLVHVELVQLMELGLSEIDAQMLHFSHWNYQCPFTGEVMNPEILALTDPESILMDVQGWQAGNRDRIVEQYQIDLNSIDYWIQEANDKLEIPIYVNLAIE